MNTCVLDQETLRFGRLLHYAGLAIVLISGSVAYAYLYTPVEMSIFDAAIRIDELAQSKQNAVAIHREHQRLSERLDEIATRYQALQGRVPANVEAGSFLRFVSDIAREEHLAINNFQPANSVEGDGYSAVEVMLDGRGSFASICSFFDRLSKINRLSKVKDVTISVDPRSGKYPMKATLIIYFGLQKGREESAQKGATHG